MGQVLVLNATFEPLNVVTVRRAIVLLLKEKAEVVEATEAQIRSQCLTLDVPLVIRLVYYVRVPRRLFLPLTRRTILARDHYACQYCGKQTRELTLDHVVPRHLGGKHDWDNVVSACKACNHRKAGRLPAEAGMKPIRQPCRPAPRRRYLVYPLAAPPQEWQKYLPQ